MTDSIEQKPSFPGAAHPFDTELAAVRGHLDSAFGELDSGLRHFVRKDLAAAEPFPLAVVVLSAGLPEEDSDTVRGRRIHLAAALEMLRLALSIHEDLVSSSATRQAEKSFIGATILVGDYCFSRSASLAAQTDSPFVVEVFSNALKAVSEGRLRTHFSEQDATASYIQAGTDKTDNVEPYREFEILCRAGAQAAAHLAALSPQISHGLAEFGAEIGRILDRGETDSLSADIQALISTVSDIDQSVDLGVNLDINPDVDSVDGFPQRTLPAHQKARWQYALNHLVKNGNVLVPHTNGKMPG